MNLNSLVDGEATPLEQAIAMVLVILVDTLEHPQLLPEARHAWSARLIESAANALRTLQSGPDSAPERHAHARRILEQILRFSDQPDIESQLEDALGNGDNG